MYQNIKSKNNNPIFLLIITLAMLILVATIPSPSVTAAATVTTDKLTYMPGDSVNVRGTASINSIVSIQLFNPDGYRVAIAQTKADENGQYSKENVYAFKKTDKTGTWTVKAYQGGISAEIAIALEGAAPPIPDTTSPKLSLTIKPDKNTYKDERIGIEVTANEELSSVVMDVTQSGGVKSTVTPSPAIDDVSKWTANYNIASEYDGKAIIRTLAKDLAGNSAEISLTFTVDTIPPKVTITAPSRTETQSITVSGTVDDPSISSVSVEVFPATSVPVDVINGEWSIEVTLTATGTNTIIATAIDVAGNTGKSSTAVIYVGTLEVLVDKVGKLESDIATLEDRLTNIISADLSSLESEMSELKSSVEGEMSTLSTLIIVAVALSLVAAIFAIVSVVTITRKIVLK